MSRKLQSLLFLFALCTLPLMGCEDASADAATVEVNDEVIEVACGMCQLNMDASSCEPAVRIEGKTYFMDGAPAELTEHEHDADGICMCIREAKVTGKVVDGRFKAEKFELQPQETPAGDDTQDNGAQDNGAQDNGAQDNGAQDAGAQNNG